MSTKVSDLTALVGSGLAAADVFYVIDGGTSKKIVASELFAGWPAAITTEMLGSDAVAADELLISDGGVAKTITIEELFSALVLLGVTLADIPQYADQAAAATGLAGTGRFWRQTSTGLLGITIT
jgi:hypothetical protein